MNQEAIIAAIQESLPGLLAVYAFGSLIQGTAGPDTSKTAWPTA